LAPHVRDALPNDPELFGTPMYKNFVVLFLYHPTTLAPHVRDALPNDPELFGTPMYKNFVVLFLYHPPRPWSRMCGMFCQMIPNYSGRLCIRTFKGRQK
jgi:hypothetical protein